MERISGLTANQVAKELQGYKRYNGKTQKEIKDKLGGITNLRDELKRLEQKYDKSKTIKSKSVEIKSKKSVKKSKNMNTDVEIMNDDVLYNIMLNAKYNELKNLCQLNKKSAEYCHSKQFWNDKLNKENLPSIKIHNWSEQYKLLLDAYEEAKLMILLNAIEYDTYDLVQLKPEIKTEADKYNIVGEGAINIFFNESVDNYYFIYDVLPKSIIFNLMQKYNEGYEYYNEIEPTSIQLYPFSKNGIRFTFIYEILKDEYYVKEKIYIDESEMLKLLTYFLYYSKYGHKMTFEDENQESLQYDTANNNRKLIIKVIKNIQMKNINV